MNDWIFFGSAALIWFGVSVLFHFFMKWDAETESKLERKPK